MFKKILLSVDLSEPVNEIQEIAHLLETLGIKKVFIAHITSGDVSHQKTVKKKLERMASQFDHYDYEVKTLTGEGHTPTVVTELAEKKKVNLIVIPWRKKVFLKRSLMGSISKDIVRLTRVPVLVYKMGKFQSGKPVIDKILYGTDFESTDAAVMPYLNYLGRIARTLLIYHVKDREADPFSEEKRLRIVRKNLKRLASECGEFENVITRSAIGSPKRKIITFSKREEVDLIVIGKFDDGPMEQMLGSTAEEVSNRSHCSFLLIPQKN